MHPILFEVGGFPIYTYGVLMAAAYLLGLHFALVGGGGQGSCPDQTTEPRCGPPPPGSTRTASWIWASGSS
jgi:hypothetical protein